MTFLTTDEKELLTKAVSLMEEILETLEIMQDNDLMKDLRTSLREAKQGKTMTLDELVRDLHLEANSKLNSLLEKKDTYSLIALEQKSLKDFLEDEPDVYSVKDVFKFHY